MGLGKTGASCVRYLAKRGDRGRGHRFAPRAARALRSSAASRETHRRPPRRLRSVAARRGHRSVLMSPGVSLEEPIAQRGAGPRHRGARRHRAVRARGARAGDRRSPAPTARARSPAWSRTWRAAAGRRVLAGGNLGDAGARPARRAGAGSVRARAVELPAGNHLARSSSQAAVVLNVTPDHMDRYASLDDVCARQGAHLRAAPRPSC